MHGVNEKLHILREAIEDELLPRDSVLEKAACAVLENIHRPGVKEVAQGWINHIYLTVSHGREPGERPEALIARRDGGLMTRAQVEALEAQERRTVPGVDYDDRPLRERLRAARAARATPAATRGDAAPAGAAQARRPAGIPGEFAEIHAALVQRRREGEQFPRLGIMQGGSPLQLFLTGERARIPGSINVTNGGRYGHADNEWYGRIYPDGTFEASRDLSEARLGPILESMRSLARSPVVTQRA